MLVIDRVKFRPLNQVHGIGKLEHNSPTRSQKFTQAPYEVINVRGVGEHIVSQDQVCLALTPRESGCRLLAKEFDQRLDSLLLRHPSNICGWFNSQTWNRCML